MGWSLLYAVSRSYRLTWVAPRKALPYLPSPFVIIVYHRLNGLSIVFLKKFCRPGRLHLSLMQVQLPCFYCRCQRCGRRRLRTIVLLPFISVIPLFNLYERGSDHSPRKCSLVRSFHKVDQLAEGLLIGVAHPPADATLTDSVTFLLSLGTIIL